MLLGDIIRDLTDEQMAMGALLALDDFSLVARIEATRKAHGETAGGYAANAVARFADGAGDEDWVGLMGAMERTRDPAAACLKRMIEWSLKQDAAPRAHACSCGHEH